MAKIHKNDVFLAGEYAVLAQLALRGYVANMTLGRTKGIDILVANPNTGRMRKIEVKTSTKSLHLCVRSQQLINAAHPSHLAYESTW
jgi:hypothetical protein